MSKVNEIMEKYKAGEITVEEANKQLRQQGANFHLEPMTDEERAAKKQREDEQGYIPATEEEMRATTIGHFPDQANGFGLLDSGTGTLDKVRVKDGRLVNCDMGESYALLIIAGRTYRVKGTALVEPEPEKEAPAIPARPDMHRRKDLAGQVVRQTTKSGLYDVTYDADGYAVKARRVS